MCGIAGLLASTAAVPPDPAVLRRFAAAMVHRGPDGFGFFFHGPCALAHRRLSIVDLSAAGLQPMTNEDGSVAIAVNGEIYNHRELRADLEKRGHRFRSNSDSEVVAHLYEEEGTRVPELLRGMFALAVYDTRKRRLLLARDRFGEKPLYYTQQARGFAFASELGALLADPGIAADVSPSALDLYLSLQYVPAPESIFAQVKKLPAGCLLEVACGEEPRVRRYYELAHAPLLAGIDETEAALRVREKVEESVRMRLMSDVPLGAFLSGGVDSSIVVACMARASSKPVQTFSVGFVGAEVDELPFARIIARRFGTDHHELVVEPDMTRILASIVRHHGEPFADSSSLPTRHLCEMTRKHVTVALSGDGGDEAFGGYLRYRWGALASRLACLPPPLAQVVRGMLRMAPGARAHGVRGFGRRLAADGATRYLSLVDHFGWEERTKLYGPVLRKTLAGDAALELFRRILDASAARDDVSRFCDLDSQTYLPDDILAKMDIASMTFGLETRAPFVDHEVMALGASLPGHLKLRHGRGKYILKKAFADLVPAEIRERKKKGFALPLRGWFARPLRAFARDRLLSPEAHGRGLFDMTAVERLLARHASGEDHGERIWNLVVLEEWYREMVDGRARFQSEVEGRAAALARKESARGQSATC
jgi:asparagine synthase (glutamine-hydrolysing)